MRNRRTKKLGNSNEILVLDHPPSPRCQDLSTHHDWSIKNSIVDLLIRWKENLRIRLREERQDLKNTRSGVHNIDGFFPLE